LLLPRDAGLADVYYSGQRPDSDRAASAINNWPHELLNVGMALFLRRNYQLFLQHRRMLRLPDLKSVAYPIPSRSMTANSPGISVASMA
jgi:hypothetical protein